MKNYPPKMRAEFYAKAFPNWPAPRTDDRWLDAVWVMGNNYQGSGYYGSYPPTYLRRIEALFPDAERTLHLFSGSLPPSSRYTRFDLIENTDVRGDAEILEKYFQKSSFDLIVADPPYSDADAAKYDSNRKNVNARRVFEGIHHILMPRGHLVWLDIRNPMFSKLEWNLWGLIGVVGSTNHRFRLVTIYERLP